MQSKKVDPMKQQTWFFHRLTRYPNWSVAAEKHGSKNQNKGEK